MISTWARRDRDGERKKATERGWREREIERGKGRDFHYFYFYFYFQSFIIFLREKLQMKLISQISKRLQIPQTENKLLKIEFAKRWVGMGIY